MMHSSDINVPSRASHSVPSISSSMLKSSMLQQLRWQCSDASSASTLTMRSSTIPFPWGPHWRRIQLWRWLLKASRAGEHTDNSSSTPLPGVPAPNCLLSTTRAGKSALSSNQVPAASPPAEGPMCAGTIGRTTQLQNVILQAQLPLNLDSFQHYLACHLDRQQSQSLLWGIHEGVDIGFQGERKTVWLGNWKSAVDSGSVVSDYLTTEVVLGRKAGPFNQPPFSTYIGLLMGVVIKKCSDSVKYHIIHDLSWPPRDSVNDHINPDLYHCIYASFNQAVSLIKKQGVGTLMSKLDLADVFKHILVHPEDWPLLCSSWDSTQADSSVLRQYYIDLFLPFSLCSYPAIVNHAGKQCQWSVPLHRWLLYSRPHWHRWLPAQHQQDGRGL